MRKLLLLITFLCVTLSSASVSAAVEKRPAMLFIHGWGADQQMFAHAAKQLEADGYVTHRFDLPGHGAAPGDRKKLTRADYLRGVLQAYDTFVVRPDVDPKQVTVVGLSLGSYLAMLLSAERPDIERLVLISPATYRDFAFASEPLWEQIETKKHRDLVAWRQTVPNCEVHRAAKALCTFKGTAFIVAGEKDGKVPLSGLLELASVSRRPLIVLKDTRHVPSAQQRYAVIKNTMLLN